MKEIEDVIAPKDISPKGIKAYPAAIEQSEKLRRLARNHANEARDLMKKIEYSILDDIESEIVEITKGVRNPIRETKPKFKSAKAIQQELERRLYKHEEYQPIKENYQDWIERAAEWTSHTARLRRELRILEVDYLSSGGGI
jgi:hypothetical protein